jgi:hypothetical protein
MLMKKIALAVLIGGMTVAGTAVAADKSSAMAAVAAAKAAQKAAGAAGGEWRDTGKMIKKAEQAIADGNYGEAESVAKKAEAQGKLGKDQAMSQTGIGNAGYLYN